MYTKFFETRLSETHLVTTTATTATATASIVTQDLNIFLPPRALIIHHHNNHNRYNNIRVHVCVVYVPSLRYISIYALALVQYVNQFIC